METVTMDVMSKKLVPQTPSCQYDDVIDLEDEEHEPDCEKLPSSCDCQDVSWIWAYLPVTVESVNSGKWLLFPEKGRVDDTWEKVKILLAANRLGMAAKVANNVTVSDSVSTAANHVICVYTQNYKDVPDVFRVLVALRRSRLQNRGINYKTDDATLSGVYKTDEYAQRAGFDCTTKVRGQRVSYYTSPYLPYDPTGATERIQMFLNNIGPENKPGLVAELVKNANNIEPRITFYDPPEIVDPSYLFRYSLSSQ